MTNINKYGHVWSRVAVLPAGTAGSCSHVQQARQAAGGEVHIRSLEQTDHLLFCSKLFLRSSKGQGRLPGKLMLSTLFSSIFRLNNVSL
jgi:hypothetical protein